MYAWISVPISFAAAMLLTPSAMKHLKNRGITAPDRYKPDKRDVPTSGGIAIITSSVIAFIMIASFMRYSDHFSHYHPKYDIAFILVMLFFGILGFIDDFYDINRPTKIFFPLLLSLPLLSVMYSSSVVLPFVGVVDLGMLIYPISAVYVMVVSNLVNMHSGFNGLASGLSAILLATLFAKMMMADGRGCVFLGCVLGATIAFWCFNWYPARIFLGNIGSLSLGAVIGAVIVANGFFVSGFIMLIPHTVNFIMYVFWRVMHRMHPDDRRWQLTKFGNVRADGTLNVPNALTLKWVLPYHFRMTEVQAVLAMYALSAPFCIASLFIPF